MLSQELSEVVREFSDGGTGKPGTNKVLYDDFVDMLVVASPRCACPFPRTSENERQEQVIGFVCTTVLSGLVMFVFCTIIQIPGTVGRRDYVFYAGIFPCGPLEFFLLV